MSNTTVADAAAAAFVGVTTVATTAVAGGVVAGLTKIGCSFFNVSLASTVGGICMFAGLGALTASLGILPILLLRATDHENDYGLVTCIGTSLIELAATTAAAAILGTPIAATVICLYVIPAAIAAVAFLLFILGKNLLPNNDAYEKSFSHLQCQS